MAKHGGNMRALAEGAGRPMDEILDFSANINPMGPPEWLRPLISSHVSSLVHYPDPDCSLLVEAASARYGVPADEVLVGNGSTEILHTLPRALDVAQAVIPVPAYADYAVAASLAGLPVKTISMPEEKGFSLDFSALHPLPKGSLVFLGRPNNPTGSICDAEELRSLASRNSDSWFVIDEAFADFVEGMERMISRRTPNMIVLCSLTKSYAIPGLRLGLAIANEETARKVRGLLPPWSVNTLAQAVGERALRDEEYLILTRKYVEKQREYLARELEMIPGLVLYPGKANFLLLRILREDMDAPELAQRLLREGMAIRVCDNFEGLDARFFRIAVRREEENARLCRSLRAAMGAVSGAVQRRKPALMFCGTSSNAGKSLLTAALCRILLQDGYRVAPFKSQNMALNSYVTRDGGEMGRAQVVQAQACRVDPDVRMNPILLKPVSDIGAQVVVRGEPRGNMDVEQYIRYKPAAFKEALDAYDSLAAEYDAIVLEGAGSPAEVNLKHHDIVNLAMARHARAPVLIVGDIDRGGVFASFVGTLEVLEEWERALVKGLVINRFRGRRDLLDDAISYVQNHTGLPVLGVVPFLSGHGLPEEDSVGFKSGLYDDHHSREDGVEIGVIDLPHISNFTDLDPLRIEPDVSLKIIRSPRDLNRPDAVILPGSKSVASDLAYLRDTGLASKLMDLPAAGAEVIGICGGFQMLGDEIADPHRIESCGETVQGLGLLPISTVLASGKTLDRVSGKHLESGLPVRGYEIHHGQTTTLDPLVLRDDGEVIGTGLKGGNIWGTYLHGLFDEDRFRRWFLDRLRTRRGMPAMGKIRAVYDLEPALEQLANHVRENVEIEKIYRLMGLR